VGFVTEFLKWLQALPLSVFIHKTAWAFTTVEVVHVFAIAFMIATIMIVDIRLLGYGSAKRPFTDFSRMLLPFTWAAFAIAVIAGALLFMSRPLEYFGNAVFWTKMALIGLAGINMIVFEFVTVRGVREWDLAKTPPLAARLAGGISITCWLLVLFCGRLIGFTLQIE
jgi:steroid 5-alpha reductase family enzyme